MELAVDFECPACHNTHTQKLIDLSPGGRPPCDCGIHFVLTENGLKDFERRLEEFFRA